MNMAIYGCFGCYELFMAVMAFVGKNKCKTTVIANVAEILSSKCFMAVMSCYGCLLAWLFMAVSAVMSCVWLLWYL